MDVAKYIGLFLLKNEHCYVNGLGTLRLERQPARYDGEYLHAGFYDISMVSGGNVDESLSNYIATNEQISITKATNALKDYSTETKNRLQAGHSVELPHIGRFVAEDGRIDFIAAPQLQYKAPPVAAKKGIAQHHTERPPIPQQAYMPATPVGAQMPVQSAERPTPQPTPAYVPPESGRLNWARIIFVLLLLVVLAGAAYYAYMRYVAPPVSVKPALSIPATVEEPVVEEPATENMPLFDDSTLAEDNPPLDEIPPVTARNADPGAVSPPLQAPADEAPANKPPVKMVNIKAVVNTYDNKDSAYKRKTILEARGNKAEVIKEDEDYYFVVIPITAAAKDTARLLDSMTRRFNPNGVFVY